MFAPIVATKLYIPQIRTELVQRPRLLEQLYSHDYAKFTLISAPAGFGKTTLVSSWIHDIATSSNGFQVNSNVSATTTTPYTFTIAHGKPTIVWLSLDEHDNTPSYFWSYLLAALQKIDPTIGQNMAELLQTSHSVALESLMSSLINDLVTISEPFTLVFDDYHVIENSTIHEFIEFLLAYMPPQMHLVIISRTDPPLPLPRLRARGYLNEIRTDQLRFTLSETSTLLNDVWELGLSKTEVTCLNQRTEGWATGLQLAVLGMRRHNNYSKFINNFNGAHLYILDYFKEEIFDQQPQTIQTFLLETSILTQLTASLCDVVVNGNDSQYILSHLARTNLFIVPLDDHRCWYRYHQLFAELLNHLLHKYYTVDEINLLYCRVALWYQQQQLIDEAIQYSAKAEDWENIEQLIIDNAKAMHAQGDITRVLRWLETLPESWLTKSPYLSIIYAWAKFSTGNLMVARQHLYRVEQQLDWNDDKIKTLTEHSIQQELLHGMLALKAQITLLNGDIEQSIELSKLVLNCIPTDVPLWRGVMQQNLGMAYWLKGDIHEAEQVLLEYQNSDQPDSITTLVATSNMAELHRMHGRFRQAEAMYKRVLHLADTEQERKLPMIVGLAHVELGNILYEWNETEEAVFHLQRSLELGEQGGGLRVLVRGYFGLACHHLAEGEFEQVETIIQKLKQIIPLDTNTMYNFVQLLQTQLWIAQDNLEAAALWIQQKPLTPSINLKLLCLFEYIICAQVLIAVGKIDKAIDILTHLLTVAESEDQRLFKITAYTFLAIAYQAKGEHQTEALTAIKQALILAEPEGFIRTFVDGGPPVASLLLNVLDNLDSPTANELPTIGYINKLLGLLNVGIGAAVKPTEPVLIVDTPTPRELEVLELIATGLSNQEITQQLVISKNTLKTHIKNIYSKLGTRSRIQAVAKAKAMRLL